MVNVSKKNFFRQFWNVAAYLVVFTGCFKEVYSQTDDYRFTPADSAFTMEVVRDKFEVIIKIHFRDASLYSYIIIEKTDDLKNEFRQCGYIDLKEDKIKNGEVVKKDRYTRSMYTASYYRLIVVSKEGVSRTYSPVRLPGEQKE